MIVLLILLITWKALYYCSNNWWSKQFSTSPLSGCNIQHQIEEHKYANALTHLHPLATIKNYQLQIEQTEVKNGFPWDIRRASYSQYTRHASVYTKQVIKQQWLMYEDNEKCSWSCRSFCIVHVDRKMKYMYCMWGSPVIALTQVEIYIHVQIYKGKLCAGIISCFFFNNGFQWGILGEHLTHNTQRYILVDVWRQWKV